MILEMKRGVFLYAVSSFSEVDFSFTFSMRLILCLSLVSLLLCVQFFHFPEK